MNRLADQSSLYLRQHAANPVDWFPWGDDAFAAAKAADKPILVSIGYSACHWCHVMAHESFEDPYIAKLMNTHFICIKVDREELPEIDRVYMDAVQMLYGHGGWPLNVFCLPDGRPFAGGTYFPPDDRRGGQTVPWPQLLVRIADFYNRQRDDLVQNAEAIMGNLMSSLNPVDGPDAPLPNSALVPAAHQIIERADPEYGGFGDAPKFPPAMTLDFLMALRASAAAEAQPALCKSIDATVNRSLTAMAHGGIYDHIGGGFARYAVDRFWLIPHFEKMLYDNALLLDCFSKAARRFHKPLYHAVIAETIDWLTREMLSPSALFAAAIDADADGHEGAFTVWSVDEIHAALPQPLATRFCQAYGITPEGNFENSGKSNPALLDPDFATRCDLADARLRLRQVRDAQRTRPATDPKILTNWNALLIRGLAHAAFTAMKPAWFSLALNAAKAIQHQLLSPAFRLAPVAYPSDTDPQSLRPQGTAKLDDYAYFADACLTIAQYAALFDHDPAPWIKTAQNLANVVFSHFDDPQSPGFFLTADDHHGLIHRAKDWFDNATPSGNSAMVHVCACLATLTGDATFDAQLQRLRTGFHGIAANAPAAIPYALAGFTHAAIGIAKLSFGPQAPIHAVADALRTKAWRPVFFLPATDASLPADAFQLCVGTQCLAPTQSPESIADAL